MTRGMRLTLSSAKDALFCKIPMCQIQILSQALFTMTFQLTDKSKKIRQFSQKFYENTGKPTGLLFCGKFPRNYGSNDVTWEALWDFNILAILLFI